MSLEEKFDLIRVTEDGIRYKKKRKHHELKQIIPFKESDLNKKLNEDKIKKLNPESKGKRMKQSKKEEIGLSKNLERERLITNTEDEVIFNNKESKIRLINNFLLKIIVIKDEQHKTSKSSKNIPHSKSQLQSTEVIENDNKNKSIQKLDNNNINHNLNNNIQLSTNEIIKNQTNIQKILPISSSGESEVKKLLNSEFERVKTTASKLEENLYKEHTSTIIKLLKSFCNKNGKNTNKIFKVKGKN